MTNISKRPLPEKEQQQIFLQLNRFISGMGQGSADAFLHDLLGQEERVMLAKRFAIIVLLVNDFSSYQIGKKLRVSPTTVEAIKAKLEEGTYDRLLRLLDKNKKNYLQFWETLDSILHLGGIMPHYNGIDRYKWIKPSS